MLTDVRAQAKVRDFLLQWLKVDQPPTWPRTRRSIPTSTPDRGGPADVAGIVPRRPGLGRRPDFRRLLDADQIFLNGRLAKFYGLDLPEDAPFQKVSWEPPTGPGV